MITQKNVGLIVIPTEQQTSGETRVFHMTRLVTRIGKYLRGNAKTRTNIRIYSCEDGDVKQSAQEVARDLLAEKYAVLTGVTNARFTDEFMKGLEGASEFSIVVVRATDATQYFQRSLDFAGRPVMITHNDIVVA